MATIDVDTCQLSLQLFPVLSQPLNLSDRLLQVLHLVLLKDLLEHEFN
jgi:hypothetical protein